LTVIDNERSDELPFVHEQAIGIREMKLDYDLIEDGFDDTTNIRTMTEQARVPGSGWLIRTTLYTPHHITADVTFVPSMEEEKLFDPLA
jgi:hypothetical protein